MKTSNLEKQIGWFASIMAILMYVSWFDQIRLNMAGTPGSVILPIATLVNCGAWVAYAALKAPKDWPIILCNVLGVGVCVVTVVTAVL